MQNIEAHEAMLKAKILLQLGSPFYAVPVLHCNIQEDNSLGVPTAAVDKHGNIYYNPEWCLSLDETELPGLLCHEVMHVLLGHCTHHQDHNASWGIAQDIKINYLIKEGTRYSLPEGGYIPDIYHRCFIPFLNYTVKGIDEKSTEEIYEEIHPLMEQHQQQQSGASGEGSVGSSGRGGAESSMVTDVHIMGDSPEESTGDGDGDGDGKVPGTSSDQVLRDKWKRVMANAATLARSQGKMPAGMSSLVDDILEPKVNWREKLHRYLSEKVPVDYTWLRRSTKSAALGVYLPSVTGEKLDVLVHLDSSGSVLRDAPDFLGEIKGILGGFKSVKLTLLVADVKVQGVYDLATDDINDIMSAIGGSVKGGGGTSHRYVVEWIEENCPSAKVFITMTDGYSDMEHCLPELNMPILTALAGHYKTPNTFDDFSEVIILK